jgi:hypothetical protein
VSIRRTTVDSTSLLIDPCFDESAGSEAVPLFPADGEYVQAIAAIAAHPATGTLAEEAAYHLFAYECVERCRELMRRGLLPPRLAIPFWPASLFEAAGVRVHALREIASLLPRAESCSWVRREPSELAAAAARFLGRAWFDPSAYARCLEHTAAAGAWRKA